jgi:hypothetical protein
VRSTCGCTIPRWSKDPIYPGEQGSLTVEFDPTNRLGTFHKTIQIQSTASNSNMFVTLMGKVLPSLKEEKLNYRIGNLSLKSKHVNFGYIFKGETNSQVLAIANQTDKAMEIDLEDIPPHIIAHVFPSTLKPGEYGQIEVHYNTSLIDDWDVIIDRLKVIINGEVVKKETLAITANIREDFSNYTEEQLLNAPVAHVDVKNHVFDTITSDKKQQCSYTITNNGDSDLIIRALKPSCGCTIAKHRKRVLSPGRSTKIEAIFDPKGKSGDFKNAITVVTNDPKAYKQYFTAEGFIKR